MVGAALGEAIRNGAAGIAIDYLADATNREPGSAQGYVLGLFAFAGGLGIAVVGAVLGRKRRESPLEDADAPMKTSRELLEMAMYGIMGGILGSLTLGFLGGVAIAATLAVALALVATLEKPMSAQMRNGPLDLLGIDRTNAIFLLVVFMVAVGVPIGIALGVTLGAALGIIGGLGGGVTIGVGVVLGYTAWGRWLIVTRLWLPLRGRLPWRVPAFLTEAHRVGVFRQAGGVFQFRHARLQDRLQNLGT